MKMIFLVDGDNNIGTGLKGIEMLSEQDTVLIFYQKGTTPTKIRGARQITRLQKFPLTSPTA